MPKAKVRVYPVTRWATGHQTCSMLPPHDSSCTIVAGTKGGLPPSLPADSAGMLHGAQSSLDHLTDRSAAQELRVLAAQTERERIGRSVLVCIHNRLLYKYAQDKGGEFGAQVTFPSGLPRKAVVSGMPNGAGSKG